MELCIDRLTKQYGHKLAVDRVDLELHQGVYGLLGANGAGKTTLMRMLCDILTPTSGNLGQKISRQKVRILSGSNWTRSIWTAAAAR